VTGTADAELSGRPRSAGGCRRRRRQQSAQCTASGNARRITSCTPRPGARHAPGRGVSAATYVSRPGRPVIRAVSPSLGYESRLIAGVADGASRQRVCHAVLTLVKNSMAPAEQEVALGMARTTARHGDRAGNDRGRTRVALVESLQAPLTDQTSRPVPPKPVRQPASMPIRTTTSPTCESGYAASTSVPASPATAPSPANVASADGGSSSAPCAPRGALFVSPAQPGGTRKEVSGPNDLPGSER
jgi:hypothetical protein